MSDVIKTGDRVRITIEGTVGNYKREYNGCHEVETDSGITHYAFFGGMVIDARDGETRYGVKVEKLESPESFEVGQVYIDASGLLFARINKDGARYSPWRSVMNGAVRSEMYPIRPLRKLVPEDPSEPVKDETTSTRLRDADGDEWVKIASGNWRLSYEDHGSGYELSYIKRCYSPITFL